MSPIAEGQNSSFSPIRGQSVMLISSRADYGGGPEQLFQIASSLMRDYRMSVACPRNEPYFPRLESLLGSQAMIEIPYRRFCLRTVIKLWREMGKRKVSLLHSHGKGAGIYSRILSLFSGVSCIHTFHGIHTGEYGVISRALYLLLERTLCFFSRNLVCVSSSELNRAKELRIGSDLSRVLIENGVKIPNDVRPEENFREEPLQVLSVTRNDFAKNPQLLIPIARYLREWGMEKKIEILAVGIKHAEELRQMARSQGVGSMIKWLEPQRDLSKFYKQALCFLSTSRWEGMPLSLLEAMSYGCPVVASRVVGNCDLVLEGETGFFYSPDDPETAAKKIQRLAEDPNCWNHLSKQSLIRVKENFSWEKMTRAYQALYAEILNKQEA